MRQRRNGWITAVLKNILSFRFIFNQKTLSLIPFEFIYDEEFTTLCVHQNNKKIMHYTSYKTNYK